MATLLSAFVAPPCVVGKQKKSSLLAFQLQQQQHSSLNVAVGTTTTYSTRKLGTVRFWSSCNAKHESNNVCGEFKVMVFLLSSSLSFLLLLNLLSLLLLFF